MEFGARRLSLSRSTLSSGFYYIHSYDVDILAGVVGWITQLVVDSHVRKQYIATQLLQTLKAHPLFQHVTAVGLISSHPAACNALAKYAGTFTHVYVHICHGYYN
jgi:hypothetical protein